ncbi:class I SAM-dependent methyltransferase [Streptacidiphilus melanogenes]|uniref:class I SAM-dependent methyltransferase n=1 Tax=Streptacidiphilus melanogenes TaxID=411235 RepID=UPI000694AAC8|nr:class I SAM-dependent methyltransferase [Streptacidiphilus melanogenes]
MTTPEQNRSGSRPTGATAEEVNVATWYAYGTHHLARGTEIEALDAIPWAFGHPGPGAGYLGALEGRRVLDLGCGIGQSAAHLARDHRAHVTAVDSSASQLRRAEDRFGEVPDLTFVHADAAEFLQRTPAAWDVIYSCRGALCHTAPEHLLPAIAAALKPSGLFAASVLHTNDHGSGPGSVLAPRPEQLRMVGAERTETVMRWVLTPDLWQDVLTSSGFTGIELQLCPSSNPDSHAVTTVFRASRPATHPEGADSQ